MMRRRRFRFIRIAILTGPIVLGGVAFAQKAGGSPGGSAGAGHSGSMGTGGATGTPGTTGVGSTTSGSMKSGTTTGGSTGRDVAPLGTTPDQSGKRTGPSQQNQPPLSPGGPGGSQNRYP
jgi:hypothetical protein